MTLRIGYPQPPWTPTVSWSPSNIAYADGTGPDGWLDPLLYRETILSAWNGTGSTPVIVYSGASTINRTVNYVGFLKSNISGEDIRVRLRDASDNVTQTLVFNASHFSDGKSDLFITPAARTDVRKVEVVRNAVANRSLSLGLFWAGTVTALSRRPFRHFTYRSLGPDNQNPGLQLPDRFVGVSQHAEYVLDFASSADLTLLRNLFRITGTAIDWILADDENPDSTAFRVVRFTRPLSVRNYGSGQYRIEFAVAQQTVAADPA